MFVPGNNERFLKKSTSLHPDILCFDLEDSVPSNEKEAARCLVAAQLASQEEDKLSPIYVRINSVDSGMIDGDLESVIGNELDGIVLPKIGTSKEVTQVIDKIHMIASKRRLTSRIQIIPSMVSISFTPSYPLRRAGRLPDLPLSCLPSSRLEPIRPRWLRFERA